MIGESCAQNAKVFVDECIEFIDAAETGDIAGIRKMLDNGLHPDTQGPKGWTALRKAALRNKFDIAFELLKRGADVDAVNYTGKTALMMACAYGNYEVATLLLFFGADPDRMNCGGRTALMIAASHGHEQVVGALLNSPGVNVGRKDPNGKTALDMAVHYGYDTVAKMLEAAGISRSQRPDRIHKQEQLNKGGLHVVKHRNLA
jgi:ankyrin repeat protein